MKFSTFIQDLKKKLFGSGSSPAQKVPEGIIVEKKPADKPQISVTEPFKKIRQPYFIQIGFDFGTSYSKCICRDLVTEKAWVHLPLQSDGQEYPFLMSSVIRHKEGMFTCVDNTGCHYPENGLYHLKQAMVKTAMKQWDDAVLKPYKSSIGTTESDKIHNFVESSAVFYLARSLGDVRVQVQRRMKDFGKLSEDYMAVNLAVPVADAEQPAVNAFYNKVLAEAWYLADELAACDSISMHDLESLRKKYSAQDVRNAEVPCFIYPEVSANVQGFVRSRVSSPGMYLFSDTGASTVDQSVFIFARNNNTEHLTYLIGRVLPLGSSNIERQAAECSGNVNNQTLEDWRVKKERLENSPELKTAKEWLADKLATGTQATLAYAKQKLYVPDQLNDIRLIFGGGGHCDHPYKTSVMKPFSGQLFRQDINPDIVGLPTPRDLELDENQRRWMKRLSVAYGLSFEKNELVGFTYPKNVEIPAPDEIWRRRKIIPDAPTMDDC